jgi:hypothetical protein
MKILAGYSQNEEVKVGGIVARNGCWQRKYRVEAITVQEDPNNHHWPVVILQLQYLGDFYAGDPSKNHKADPKRTRVKEIKTIGYKTKEGLQIACGYWPDLKTVV